MNAATSQRASAPSCPSSGTPGKAVEHITLRSLVAPTSQGLIHEGPWFYCSEPNCSVVYFDGGGATIDKEYLTVRVGTKERVSPRPICYCFGHTVEDIESDVEHSGSSPIPDSITEKCRKGLHRCEETNPQGSCCLGNVRKALKEALAQAPSQDDSTPDECCEPPHPPASSLEAERSRSLNRAQSLGNTSRAGRLASVGALATAALSSACCWLPLTLLAFGASAAGVAGFFERYRPLFLGASVLLLGVGFYVVYARPRRCVPDGTCTVPSTRALRLNKVLLWTSAALVTAFALFPHYATSLLGGPSRAGHASVESYDLEFAVHGMTCEACALTLERELGALEGVVEVWVSYDQGLAKLNFRDGVPPPSPEEVAAVVERHGYRALLGSDRQPPTQH